ncbi:hypothetical protein E8D34_12980 [Nocardioides sp. GY 10113]|uniref:hypothetical protein n=1 Tax=Nocardioides sp. GY 10113 TaxID=2569761 RepID=UPI0010A92394|nr:hypothetical protein [Nocardioides sp. GY 10113]TIC84997.1 hypothetical protein E8D34_12980 [Nocardioides sp. GY 10113]
MNETTSPTLVPGRHTADPETTPSGSTQERRNALRTRHARGLTTLMTERSDLRGVHALADFVADAVRWSA